MEKDEANSCNLVDPLARYSGLSLFPSVCGLSSDYSNPNEPETELDYIHKRLKAEALRCPKKLVEQGVSIVDDGSELLNTKIMSYLPRENKNEEAVVEAMEQPRERRPALNRKRAKFSLRPDSCLTVVNLEQTMDISHIKDPEEYFLAFERLENAKREIRRQTGCVLTEFDQVTSSPIVRPRRPEIPRRPVKYKHLLSSLVSKNEENDVSYEEDVGSDILNLSSLNSEQEHNQNISVQEREYLDSPTNINNKVDKILDELLSDNYCKDLEGNAVISLLEERLQIKPIEIERLSLPDLEGFRNINVKASKVNLTKPKNPLLDISNLVKGRTSLKEKHRLFSHLASSSPSKSPFASLTSLKKRILQSSPLNDPFSAHEIVELPARKISLESNDEQCGPFDTGNRSNTSHGTLSTSLVEDVVGSNKNGPNDVNEHFNGFFGLVGTENSFEDDGNDNANSNEFHIDIDANTSGSLQKSAIRDKSHSSKVKADDRKGKRKEVAPTEHNDTLVDSSEEHLSIIQQQLGESSTAIVMKDYAINVLENASSLNDDEQKDIQESGVTLKRKGKQHMENKDKKCLRRQSLAGKSSTADSMEDYATNAFENASGRNDEQKEIQEKKGKRRMVNKDKKCLRRQSLAAAGTSWESGLRRSTRIKVRPLEFWKGERFLYGRIHQSLTTVIGLKYVSPAKEGGQPTLKVKSYVSDEFKDLVELAALH